MPELLLSKSGYAKRCGVGQNAVSNWIKRGKLTPPALRSDGTIDVTLADEQLCARLNVMDAGRGGRAGGALFAGSRTPSPPALPAASVADLASHRKLLAARATIADVAAERARRELEHEKGRYCLTKDADEAFAKTLSGFLLDVEQSFQDFAATAAGLDERELLVRLRKWWRDQRSRAAAKAGAEAARLPEYVEDPELDSLSQNVGDLP